MRISDWSSDVCSSDLVCPLARVMRRELKKRNVDHLKVVYSEEEPMKPEISSDDGREKGGGEETCSDTARRQTPGRSEESRVGKECDSKWRSRWSPYD